MTTAGSGFPMATDETNMSLRFATFLRYMVTMTVVGVLAGCAPSVNVRADYQPGTDFSVYKTFTINDAKGEGSPFAAERIRHAIAGQLTAKGLRQLERDGDLGVHVHARMRVDTKVDVWNTGGWGYGYGSGWGGGRSYVDVRNVPVGTLVVDLVDRAKGEAVWRGIAQGTVDQNPSPEQSEQRINAAIEKLFKEFPPSK